MAGHSDTRRAEVGRRSSRETGEKEKRRDAIRQQDDTSSSPLASISPRIYLSATEREALRAVVDEDRARDLRLAREEAMETAKSRGPSSFGFEERQPVRFMTA